MVSAVSVADGECVLGVHTAGKTRRITLESEARRV
jgi:hypothetical protein